MSGRKKQPDAETEMKRTCNECGAERYVSLHDARTKMPGNTLIKQVTFVSAFGPRDQRGRFTSHETALELQRARVSEAMRCPQCGSESFSEVEVPI